MNRFVIDTNVLLYDPEALHKFQGEVVIPIYVIEEIDRFKKERNELGRNARETSRLLDCYRTQGNLREGILLENGATLRVAIPEEDDPNQSYDNKIIAVALRLQTNNPEDAVTLVTKDTNVRVRADVLGLTAISYEETRVSLQELYKKTQEIYVTPEQIQQCHDSSLPTAEVNLPEGGLTANEYVLLKNGAKLKQGVLARFSKKEQMLTPLPQFTKGVWGLRPRNKEQRFALDALLDDRIQLVSLVGKAGTGKTLCALAAGLLCTLERGQYQRLLVSRPIIPLGKDIGYLPGTIEEKLNPWMQPIFDNLQCLFGHKEQKESVRAIETLFDQETLKVEPLTFIRGRSIPKQFFIVDEVQNLTPHEIKTILTRAGEGTKIVLTGDPHQIDNPYMDSESNGLTYVINRFKDEDLAASITLLRGERSALAELASDLL